MVSVRKALGSLILLGAMFTSGAAMASGTCAGEFFNPMEDPDWNNMFPITIGGATLSSGPPEPSIMGIETPCDCGPHGMPGIGMTYWEPMYLAEVTPNPGCFSTLDGEKVLTGFEDQAGSGRGGTRDNSTTRRQVHWMRYPLFPVLNMATGLGCLTSGGFDIGDMTELHDWWQDGMWSAVHHPETALFGNPLAALSCTVEAAVSSITRLPMDSMFWCMGAQGSVYPLAGTKSDYHSAPRINLRSLGSYKMAYTRNAGLLATIGPTAKCGASYLPFWIKGQYRMDIVQPVALDGAITYGPMEFLWAYTPQQYNAVRNDAAYMIWAGRQCCDIPFL